MKLIFLNARDNCISPIILQVYMTGDVLDYDRYISEAKGDLPFDGYFTSKPFIRHCSTRYITISSLNTYPFDPTADSFDLKLLTTGPKGRCLDC